MKNTSILLNAGRGSAVNTEDFCEALIQGQIYGAGLDVTDQNRCKRNINYERGTENVILLHT